jgi:hypothetical protein
MIIRNIKTIRINNIIPIVIRGKLNGKTIKKPLNTIRLVKNKNARIINDGTMNINKIRNIIRSKNKSPFIFTHFRFINLILVKIPKIPLFH